MKAINRTALLLVCYQNDYFSPDGNLYKVVNASSRVSNVLGNTISLIEGIKATSMPIIHTPISFSHDYSELVDPVGVLKTIQEVNAFQEGSKGAMTIPLIKAFEDRIQEVHGKQGLNAFTNTNLDFLFSEKGVNHIVIAGVVSSVCIDTTGRDAHNRGYTVTILRDCTAGRSVFEHDYYCDKIFPIYASVMNHRELICDLIGS